MLEMIMALIIVHFNYCLTSKIEVSKQRHRWAIDVIWLLTVHLCPVGPRVLDTCSLNIRAIHIREDYGTPLSQSLIQSYFLGPQTSLRFYLLSCTYAMLLLYLRLCEEHTVLFRIVARFRGVDKPSHTFGFPVVHSRPHNLKSVSEPAGFVAGIL